MDLVFDIFFDVSCGGFGIDDFDVYECWVKVGKKLLFELSKVEDIE